MDGVVSDQHVSDFGELMIGCVGQQDYNKSLFCSVNFRYLQGIPPESGNPPTEN